MPFFWLAMGLLEGQVNNPINPVRKGAKKP
jgi:hypothetical protein